MADQSYLNWPFLEDHHRALKTQVEDWVQLHKTLLSHSAGQDIDAHCRHLVQALGQAGFLAHCVPSETQNALDVRSLCLLREALAYHHGLADFSLAMQGLGSGALSLFGNAEQKRAYLPAVANGDKIAAFALSEKEAGSDVANVQTTASEDGNGYVLNGEKAWISNAGIADFYVVFARLGNAAGAKGLSAFLVDKDSLGFHVTERTNLIAPHPIGTLSFQNCRLSRDALIGQKGEGFKIAMATLDVFRSTVGAAALGFARRALDEALARATTRELFGGTLAELQMTQASLADMALQIDASALLIYRAAWTKDQGQARVTREAAMAKLHATEAAQDIIDKALQLHGGQGVVSGEIIEQLYREVRALRIYEGASEVQKLVIARQTLQQFTLSKSGVIS